MHGMALKGVPFSKYQTLIPRGWGPIKCEGLSSLKCIFAFHSIESAWGTELCVAWLPHYIERNACLMDVPEGLRYKPGIHFIDARFCRGHVENQWLIETWILHFIENLRVSKCSVV